MQIKDNEVYIKDEMIKRFLESLEIKTIRKEDEANVYNLTSELLFNVNQARFLFETIIEQVRRNKKKLSDN
ncbi:hypothetical protein [Sutcliffiella horikoshii]|uniref:hypothetical protein n=1 Tax=Sutcliffiella horikoshii TaxID=79883 RepID=UPI001F2258A9|nr:hypothetical protein [Sutcliffiella horikoshii]MCG1020776.1 hypothetical protein [Sutcliffiella horikoshii]